MSGGAVAVAAALDVTVREPLLAVHPVRLAGRYLDAVQRLVPAEPRGRAVAGGGLAWAAGAVSAWCAGTLVAAASKIDWSQRVRHAGVSSHVATKGSWSPRSGSCAALIWASAITGVALWPLFAHRMLLDEVAAVEEALERGVGAGRTAVARIVSRDVSELSESQVRQAAIESLAENLSDSVIAPLLWFTAGGLPAAALYRYANTADAAWGYRTGRWRHAGVVAARADDLLNLIPARITAVALSWSAPGHWSSGDPGKGPAAPRTSAASLRAEAARTSSPNAGWPMAAMALRLGVRLEKSGSYVLNPAGREPVAADTRAALRLARRVGWAAIGAAAVLSTVLSSAREWRCRR